MGAVGDWFDNMRIFDNMIQSSDEDAQEELANTNQDLWQDFYDAQPSVNDLQGYGIYGDAPDEYVDQYVSDNATLGGMDRSGRTAGQRPRGLAGVEREGLEADANEAYIAEQLANDPLWGLQVADNSQLEGAAADPYSIEAQRTALQNMQGIYDAGGYTAAERAQLQMSQRDAAMNERSQRLAVQENARARGMGGGGMELMGALAAQQGGANRANDWANQIAVAGQQRAMQALQNSGNMAAQMRGQSFNEDTTRRQAADDWNRWQTNLIGGRQAQMADANQQAWNNQLVATQGLTGGNEALSGYHAAQEQEGQDNWQHTVQTAAAIASGGATGGAGAAIGAVGRTGATGADPYELPSATSRTTRRAY
jgi:hypothetical protein